MRITGASLPFSIAKAYGVKPAGPSAPVSPPAAPLAARSSQAAALVAGTVSTPVNFEIAARIPGQGVLPMYTRAADKVEAAVAVQVGRKLDITG
jgi:hypothetical protein